MAVIVEELMKSRQLKVGFRDPNLTLRYIVTGTLDETEAVAAVEAVAPLTYLGLTRVDTDVDPQGGGVWYGTVTYNLIEASQGADGGGEQNGTDPPAEEPDPGDPSQPIGPEYSFDASGEMTHITQSIATRWAIKRGGGVAPDFKRAIGVGKDGAVEGCDVFAPKFDWQVTYRFNAINRTYMRALRDLCGTVNSTDFYGAASGECLFVGASGQGGNDGSWSITYKFKEQPNQTDIEICDGLTVPEKQGWDYLWVYYESITDGNMLVEVPAAAYVEQVYHDGDFSRLGIGA